MRLLLVAVLVAACGNNEEAKLREARAKAAEAQQHMREAQKQAAEAQHNLETAQAEQKAAVEAKAAVERELAEAQQQRRDLIEQATAKLDALKKQRAAISAGPKRKELDVQIEQLEKVIQESR